MSEVQFKEYCKSKIEKYEKDKFFQYSYQLLAPVTNKEYFLRLQ